MSNLLTALRGFGEGFVEKQQEIDDRYQTNLTNTYTSLVNRLQPILADRKALEAETRAKLAELASLGIDGPAADQMIRSTDEEYQNRLEDIRALGAPDQPLTGKDLQRYYGFRFAPGVEDRDITQEDILNGFMGQFAANTINPEEEEEARSTFAQALGFGRDPTDAARRRVAAEFGMPEARMDALLQDTLAKEEFDAGVTFERQATEAEKIDEESARMRHELLKQQFADLQVDQKGLVNELIIYVTRINPETNLPKQERLVIPAGTSLSRVRQIQEREIYNSQTLRDQATAQREFDRSLLPQEEEIRNFTSTERSTFNASVHSMLNLSDIWGEGWDFDPRTGLSASDTAEGLQKTGHMLTVAALMQAANQVFSRPNAFDLRVKPGNQQATIAYLQQPEVEAINIVAGQTALRLFQIQLERKGITDARLEKQVRTKQWDTLFQKTGTSNFSDELQEYIKEIYTVAGFAANQAYYYEYLTGARPDTVLPKILSEIREPEAGVTIPDAPVPVPVPAPEPEPEPAPEPEAEAPVEQQIGREVLSDIVQTPKTMSLLEAVQTLEDNQSDIARRAASPAARIGTYAIAIQNTQHPLFKNLSLEDRKRLYQELMELQEDVIQRQGRFDFDRLRGAVTSELYQGGTIIEKPQSLMQRRTGIGQVN